MALAFSLTAPMHLGGFGFLLGVSLCSFDWPGTHRDRHLLLPRLGLQACAGTPKPCFWKKRNAKKYISKTKAEGFRNSSQILVEFPRNDF